MTFVFFTRSDGNQSGRVFRNGHTGDVLSRGDSGDGGNGGDSRELHL